MTIISFLVFIALYCYVNATSVEPIFYIKGLLFAVPCVCFGAITYLTVAGKLKETASLIITIVAVAIMGFITLSSLIFLGFDAATTVTTSTNKYERVLNLSDYPSNELLKHFPDKIPIGAKNTVFRYCPAFLQGGESYSLKFKTDHKSTIKYCDEFSKDSKWSGKADSSGAEENGLAFGMLDDFGYDELPDDFTIYIFYSKCLEANWNHGRISLAAISRVRDEIIFYAEDW